MTERRYSAHAMLLIAWQFYQSALQRVVDHLDERERQQLAAEEAARVAAQEASRLAVEAAAAEEERRRQNTEVKRSAVTVAAHAFSNETCGAPPKESAEHSLLRSSLFAKAGAVIAG